MCNWYWLQNRFGDREFVCVFVWRLLAIKNWIQTRGNTNNKLAVFAYVHSIRNKFIYSIDTDQININFDSYLSVRFAHSIISKFSLSIMCDHRRNAIRGRQKDMESCRKERDGGEMAIQFCFVIFIDNFGVSEKETETCGPYEWCGTTDKQEKKMLKQKVNCVCLIHHPLKWRIQCEYGVNTERRTSNTESKIH